MKKTICAFLALALLFVMLPLRDTARAEELPHFEVSNVQGVPGSQVTVTVSLKNSPGFGGLAYDVVYDPAVLKLLSYEADLGSSICVDSGVGTYPNKVNFQYAGTSNIEGDGVLASFVFEILGTELGATEITVVPEEGTSFYYEGRTEIDFTLDTAVGAVTIVCAHAMTQVPARPSTCTEAGNNAYYTCSKCGNVYKDAAGTVETTPDAEKLPLAEHTWQWIVDKEATATEAGMKHEACASCDQKRNETEIPATGSDPIESPETGDSTMLLWGLLGIFVPGILSLACIYGKKRYQR